jgi:hypothetical protein
MLGITLAGICAKFTCFYICFTCLYPNTTGADPNDKGRRKGAKVTPYSGSHVPASQNLG